MLGKDAIVEGVRLGDVKAEPYKKLAEVSRKVAAEGAVLLKNEKEVLPLKKGEKIAVFGRSQFEYLKAGIGSGGLVNVEYCVNIYDGLKNNGSVEINETLSNIYRDYIKEHPFNGDIGWSTRPCAQDEYDIPYEIAEKAAKESDKALVVISRNSGEGQDNIREPGGYFLTEEEYGMLKTVRRYFDKVAVVLNIGNVMDMNWIDKLDIDSVLCVWLGGQEGGNAVADVLCGVVTPSGKLTDTVPRHLIDFPSDNNFGGDDYNYFCEDIYVGYRYFETFAPEKVQYPFGFGLSYTTFDVKCSAVENNGEVTVTADVKNTGKYSGAEVVEVYYGAPQGKLGKPAKELCAFVKTPVLAAGEKCTVKASFKVNDMASYDDGGYTGNKSCYVLEEGTYVIYAGTDVRTCEPVLDIKIDSLVVTERLSEVLAPTKEFKRIKPELKDGKLIQAEQEVPLRTVDLRKRIKDNLKEPVKYTGDKGYMLKDVYDKKVTMDEFIAQFTPEEIACLLFGEGMCSSKTMYATGGVIGGVTDVLLNHGIPIVSLTDGPSGMRLNHGAKAINMPCGTLIACTWNIHSAEELYVYEGIEAYGYEVDALLGPGLNIHRHPLNGRNFEYFSEDPFVSGQFATAITKGLDRVNVSGTIKHYAGNIQEKHRGTHNVIASERALREIYLKGFEMAVKSGYTTSIMTSYNKINNNHSASNYDLNTTLLRGEWGYKWIVMTDWWTRYNDIDGESSREYVSKMVMAQNDLAMVVPNAMDHGGDILEKLACGELSLYEMQRNAKNILEFVMWSNGFARYIENGCAMPGYGLLEKLDQLSSCGVAKDLVEEKRYEFTFDGMKPMVLRFKVVVAGDALEQMPIGVFTGLGVTNETARSGANATVVVSGTAGKEVVIDKEINAMSDQSMLSFKFNTEYIKINSVEVLQ